MMFVFAKNLNKNLELIAHAVIVVIMILMKGILLYVKEKLKE